MAALADGVITAVEDSTGVPGTTSGYKNGTYTMGDWIEFDYAGYFTEVDLTEFMDKLLEIEERLNSWSCGEIEVEDDTPSAGYVTLKYYTDEATPTLYKTIVVNKTTGARSQAT